MKKSFYYLIIIMAVLSIHISTMHAQQTVSTSVAPFKAYKTLEGSAEVIGQTFRAEGDNLYNEFEVEIAEAGEYYLSAWMLGAGRQDGSTIAYDIVVNGQSTALAMKPEMKDWQNAYARLTEVQRLKYPQKSNTVTLVRGRNTIAFKGYVPVVPTVEQIALSRVEGTKAVSEDNYQAFKAEIRAAAANHAIMTQNEPALPPQNPNFAYDYDLDFEYKYTSYIRCYFPQVGKVILGTADATIDHVVSIFSYDHNNYSENSSVFTVSDLQGDVFEATINTPGMYFVFIRTKSPNSIGSVDFLIDYGTVNGSTYFDDLPISCSRFPITKGTDLNSIYATFLLDATSENFPMITIEDDIDNPTKVLGYNAVYNRAGFSGIDKCYSIPPKVVYVLGGTSSNPQQVYKGELYTHIKKIGKETVSSMPWDDTYESADGTDGIYNCFSWVGGVVDEPWASAWENSKLDPYGGVLENFLSNTAADGTTLLRYQGATTYNLILNNSGYMALDLADEDAVIDLYGGRSDDTTFSIGHAAIRRGSDTNPHGPSWESKRGIKGNRIFHSRNSETIRIDWGVVIGHYKRASVQKSAVEMSMYESLAQGLSVIENPQITDNEKAILASMEAAVSPTLKTQFEKQTVALHSALQQRETNLAMRKFSLFETPPYAAVKNLYVQNKEAVLPLIMDAYVQNKYDNIVLLETMIAENEEYQALAEEILKRNRENQYTPDGAYIVRSAYSNGMLFVKELLKRQSDFSLKKRTQSTQKDIKYSNSDPFEVFYKDGTLSVKFFAEEASEISISIYDVNARLITQLAHGGISAGSHRYDWNYTGCQGIYFVQYTLNGNLNVKKVVL